MVCVAVVVTFVVTGGLRWACVDVLDLSVSVFGPVPVCLRKRCPRDYQNGYYWGLWMGSLFLVWPCEVSIAWLSSFMYLIINNY